MGPADMVREFHETFGVPVGTKPSLEGKRLRQELLTEEYHEVLDALHAEDVAEVAHELADLVYVIYGSALTFGIDLDAVLAEVHRANMSKVGEDGKAIFNDQGKVLKGPDFVPADVAKALGVARCAICRDRIEYLDPTGDGLAGWWAHEHHPRDHHDAVPGGAL